MNSGNNKLTLAGGQCIGETAEHLYETNAIITSRFGSAMVIYGLPECRERYLYVFAKVASSGGCRTACPNLDLEGLLSD